MNTARSPLLFPDGIAREEKPPAQPFLIAVRGKVGSAFPATLIGISTRLHTIGELF